MTKNWYLFWLVSCTIAATFCFMNCLDDVLKHHSSAQLLFNAFFLGLNIYCVYFNYKSILHYDE